jgi:hypothetical protein
MLRRISIGSFAAQPTSHPIIHLQCTALRAPTSLFCSFPLPCLRPPEQDSTVIHIHNLALPSRIYTRKLLDIGFRPTIYTSYAHCL